MLKGVGQNCRQAAMFHIIQILRFSVIHLFLGKGKIKFTLKQATKARRGIRCIAFFNLGARWGWVFNATPRPFYPPR